MSLEALPLAGRRDPVPNDSRYECLLKIASGGMATVYVGRLRGANGFWRLVAIKRAHAHLVGDEGFRTSLVAEARVASQIHHQNVVSVVDVEEPSEELLLIMDYVEGASLSQLISAASKQGKHLPVDVVVRIILDAAAGLHAAHELTGENGEPLAIVHRDVSPQNVLVGVDGAARIADFGIAKCADSQQATATGLKGKVGYMAPEYIQHRQVDRRVDVFALGVVMWEALTGERLFRNDNELSTIRAVIEQTPRKVSEADPRVPPALDAPLARALAKDPVQRYPDLLSFSRDLEAAAKAAGLDPNATAVTRSVKELFGEVLDERRETLRGLPSKPIAGLFPNTIPNPAALPPLPDATRTGTAQFRASLSDVQTKPFARPQEPVAAVVGEVTQDITSLAKPESWAPPPKSSRRWMIPVGIGIASGLLLGGILVRTNGSNAHVSSSVSAPIAPAATQSPASTATSSVVEAESSAPTVVESPIATASASGQTTKPATKTVDKGSRPRPKAPSISATPTESAHPHVEAPKQPDRPGLGY